MKLIFNNESRDYDNDITLTQLVEEYKKTANIGRVGVWVNQKMVRPAAFESITLQEGDRVSVRKVASGG